MNFIDERLNPADVETVKADLEKNGVKFYSMRSGNNCVWVSYGRVECYYILDQNHKIRDIQVD